MAERVLTRVHSLREHLDETLAANRNEIVSLLSRYLIWVFLHLTMLLFGDSLFKSMLWSEKKKTHSLGCDHIWFLKINGKEFQKSEKKKVWKRLMVKLLSIGEE